MITINLLAPAKKQEIRLIKNFLLTRRLIIISLGFLLVIALILAGTNYYLARKNKELASKLETNQTLPTGQNIPLSQSISLFNKQLKSVGKIQADYHKWSEFFLEFNRAVPNNLQITSLIFNTSDKTALIQGTAKTRDDLIQFQTSLAKSNLFKEITSPISNLLIRNDISFELRATLNF